MTIIDPEREKRHQERVARSIEEREKRNYDPTLKPPEFYRDADDTGIADLTYKPPWPKAPGWPHRTRLASHLIRSDEPVLELGCGFGIMPAMLWHEGHRTAYTGWDFCQEAIDRAKQGNTDDGHQNTSWRAADIDHPDTWNRLAIHLVEAPTRPVVVCCETLEHLEHDRELIEAIPSGTFCVFTVPQFWAISHLRKFPTPDDAYERYGEFLDARYRLIAHYPNPNAGWVLIWGYRN